MIRSTTDIANELLAENAAIKAQLAAEEAHAKEGWRVANEVGTECDQLKAQVAELAKQEPVVYRWEGVESGDVCYDGIKPLGVISQPLYTRAAPPAPVKLPGELTACGLVPMRDCAFVEGWNACLAEVLRLNAIDNTAQQYEALAGWKMVPIEPSKEMRSQIHPIADGNCSHCGNRTTLDCEENMLLSWRDMLEAAPKPED